MYKVGDRVRIVDHSDHCWWNSYGMNKWLGKTMTIRRSLDEGFYRMEEDRTDKPPDGWCWHPDMIACLELDCQPKYKEGDRVVIVDVMCDGDWNDSMKKWLGQTMTIKSIECDYSDYYRMDEDGGKWSWRSYMISAIERELLFEPATHDELSKLFGLKFN